MEAIEQLYLKKEWVNYNNFERPHSSLNYLTPDEVFYGGSLNDIKWKSQLENQTKISQITVQKMGST